ncbi:hypothetical protein EJ05DRAFT_470539 [Pseudovirgaria hyperparasitica]|uniref:U three protein 23 n=1 Tax=Pseudovirgaria hyperparasitica TaxID=470096 RepID=A0A6A6VTP4_9PEZI|nr:uncharacterized protein EJ05DRAFT_470539 [Pseudovirgaria hyperparasitica]KAF2753259.1 hypothetical protein EJ05DRAFT_470539 [Pseudovirgaria hyperparasitica]
MRGKRQKQYRKLMHQYQHTFNFREPYQVLVDAEIIEDAARFTMDLIGGLKRTCQGEIKPMITQCSMRHLYKTKNNDLIAQAKTFERRRCGHHELEEPMSTLECLSETVDPKDSGTNKHRYVVATQDKAVRATMRAKLGVPLIYINRSVMILEPMAAESEDKREKEERNKFRSGLLARITPNSGAKRKWENVENGLEPDRSLVRSSGEEDEAIGIQSRRKKVRGPKGPNPLSVKKPQKERARLCIAQEKEPPKVHTGISSNVPLERESSAGDGISRKKRRRKHNRPEKSAREDEFEGDLQT